MKSSEPVLSAQAAFTALAEGRFPQAVLLAGETGSGKGDLAIRLAQTLLCTGAEGTRPCNACSSCHKIRERIHPDLTVVGEDGADIKVDTIRALRREVSVLPNDGKRRAILLHHAHRMNPMAQNALLKTLEEPPSYAFFILISEQPAALLPTILSRCTRFTLAPAETQDAPDETLLSLLHPILVALSLGDETSLLKAAMALEKQPRPLQKSLLGLLQTALRDALFIANGLTSAPLLPSLRQESTALARAVSPERLLRASTLPAMLAARLEVNAAGAATSSALCAGLYQFCYI